MTATSARLASGEVAKRAGMSPSRIRHYEARGLLPEPDRVSGKPHASSRASSNWCSQIHAREECFSGWGWRMRSRTTRGDCGIATDP